MCFDPISMGLMAGGQLGSVFMNKEAVEKDAAARDAVMRAEGERQRKFQEQAGAETDATLTKFDRGAQENGTAQAEQRRMAGVDAATAKIEANAVPTGGSAPQVVQSDMARKIAEAVGRGRGIVRSQAKLQAYGDNQLNNGVSLNRAGQGIDMISNASRASSGIVPYELDAAGHAGDKYRTIADLFRMGGNVAGAYGMTRTPTRPPMTPTMPSESGMVYNTPGYYR